MLHNVIFQNVFLLLHIFSLNWMLQRAFKKTVFWLKNSIFVILLVLCFIELLLSSLWNWNYHYEIYSIDFFLVFFCAVFFISLCSNHQTDWYFLQTKIPSGCMKINIFTFQFRSVFFCLWTMENQFIFHHTFLCLWRKKIDDFKENMCIIRWINKQTNFSLIRFIINKTWTIKDIQHLLGIGSIVGVIWSSRKSYILLRKHLI